MTLLRDILRYAPGVVLGLLVAAWMVGLVLYIRYVNEPTTEEGRDPFAFGFVLTFVPVMTLLVPFLVGVGTSFRYRLWHYLAFTAIIAVELTFFMRWLR